MNSAIGSLQKPPQNWSLTWRGSANPFTRADVAVYLVVIGIGILQFILCRRSELFENDAANYLGLARSLVEKRSYEFNFMAHATYPPGLPALLALLSLVFGSSYAALIRSISVLATLGLIASYELLRRRQGRAVAAAACLLLASSPQLFGMATQLINSDLPFFTSSMLALLFAMSLDDRDGGSRWLLWSGFLVTLIFSLMLRSAGMALLAGLSGWLAASFLGGRKIATKRLKIFLPAWIVAVVAEGSWVAWTIKVKTGLKGWSGEYSNYFDQLRMIDPHRPELGTASLSDLPGRMIANLVIHTAHLSELILHRSWIEPSWFSPVVVVAFVLALAGLIISFRRNWGDFLDWYFVSYMGVYLLWPFDVGPRFILPVFPLAFLYLWRGAAWFKDKTLENSDRVLLWGVLSTGSLFVGSAVWTLPSHAGTQAKLSVAFWAACAVLFAALRRTEIRRSACSGLQRALQMVPLAPTVRISYVAGMAAIVVLVGAGLAAQVTLGMTNLSYNPAEDVDFVHYPSVAAAQWIESHSAANDVIMAQSAAIVHRISGRRIVSFPISSDPGFIMDIVRSQGVVYLIVIDSDKHSNVLPPERERLKSLSANYPDTLRLVQQGPSYRIFSIAPKTKGADGA